MDVRGGEGYRRASGYSLVSLLMTVVIIGALAAVSVVGVSSMTGSTPKAGLIGEVTTTTRRAGVPSTAGRGGAAQLGVSRGGGISARSACKVSADAAGSASTLYFASSGGTYPVKWSDMTNATPPLFSPAANVVVDPANPTELEGRGWKLVMTGGGAHPPTFTCSS